MKKVIRATLLSLKEQVNEQNINPTHKAVIFTELGKEEVVYCKEIPPREIFIESAIALIGRDLGISIPEPYLILATPESYPNYQEPSLLFGSKSIEYPNLFRKLSILAKEQILPLLEEYDEEHGVAVFDEWTANPDRHFGNILFDGSNHFYFIDHEFCVPVGCQPTSIIGKNRLLNEFKITKEQDKNKLSYIDHCMKAHTPKCVSYALDNIADRTFALNFLEQSEIDYLIQFLQSRVLYITNLLYQRLNIKQQPLFGEPH